MRRSDRLGRMLRFAVVGASGVVVNQGLLMLLHGALAVPLLLASLVAIETSILSNFTLNSLWTWQVDRAHPLRTWLRMAAHYHAATALTAITANWLILAAAVHLLGLDYRIANLIGIAVGSGLNYVLGEWWVFRETHSPREPSP